ENSEQIDVAILDIMMPIIDGLEVCKYLREKSKRIGIMMLTARTQEIDKVTGLMNGADDYVTKPFSPSELIARIDAMYRRVSLTNEISTEKAPETAIALGEFVLDLRSHTLTKNGEQIELTQIEFQIIEFFFSNPNAALSRVEIINFVWGENYFGQDKVIDVNIHRIRNKIEDEPSQPKHLITVWAKGYRWVV
ncbi:MAG: response regulator transcription factor, partial [Clostridia bacterium]|nr:response regulator transcription factor [Clostridia bacterium]